MTDFDPDVLATSLKAIGINAEALTPIFEKAKTAAEQLGNISLNKISDSFKTYNTYLKDVDSSSGKLRDMNLSTSKSFDTMADGLSKIITLTTKFDAFKGMSVASGAAVNTMETQLDSLIDRFHGWGNAAKVLAGSGMSQLGSMTATAAKEFLSHVASAEKLENSYINLMASTGDLGNLFDSNNKLIPGLTNNIGRYGSTLTQTATMTGETTATVGAFADKLNTIPGVMGKLIEVGAGVDGRLESTAAAFTLARGAGRQTEDVYVALKTAYENLGNAQGPVTDNVKKGTDMFALMSEASSKLGLRFDDTKDYLSSVAEHFKYVGDNTQAATNILANFSGALQNTGLTAKASVDIIKNMVSAMGNLSIGTKALVSARTGGPGGLQGAFQMEDLLRQGKVDEVAKKMQQALKQQMGGRIYSLQEAAHSPQAASQFMRQRSILKSSAFGGLAKDDESATRLLEALKQGPTATASLLKDAKGATKDVAEKGQELQKNQISVLNLINTALDRSVVLQEISLLNTARQTIGRDNPEQAKLLNNSFNAALANIQQNYSSPEANGLDNQITKQNKLAGADLVEGGKVFVDGIKTGTTKLYDSVVASAKILENDAKNKSQDTKTKSTLAKRINATRAATIDHTTQTVPTNRSIKTAVSQVAKLSGENVKHEINHKPLEINIQVSADKDLQVSTTTNNPNTTVSNLNNQTKGFTTNTGR